MCYTESHTACDCFDLSLCATSYLWLIGTISPWMFVVKTTVCILVWKSCIKWSNIIGKLIGICRKSPESGRNFLYKKFSICTIFSRILFRNVLVFENRFSKYTIFENIYFQKFLLSRKVCQIYVLDKTILDMVQKFRKFLLSVKVSKIQGVRWSRKVSKMKTRPWQQQNTNNSLTLV